MDTICINSENSKTSNSRRLLLNLSIKIDLNKRDWYVAKSNLNIYHMEKHKMSYKNNKFRMSVLMLNEKLNY